LQKFAKNVTVLSKYITTTPYQNPQFVDAVALYGGMCCVHFINGYHHSMEHSPS